MFTYKNYMKLFSLFVLAFASSTATDNINNEQLQQQQVELLGDGTFQLHGLHGEGHQCQDVSQLSSAVVSLIKMVGQHEQDGQVQDGHHRALGMCDGVSQGCTAAWCCFVCGWNCRRTRTLRGSAVGDIDSTTTFLFPTAATTTTTVSSPIMEEEALVINEEPVHANEVTTFNLSSNGSTGNYPSSLGCDGTSQGCTAWWCCTICGWNCRRNLVEETHNALAWLEGDDDMDLPGCLAGANLKLVSLPSSSADDERETVVHEESLLLSNP